MRVLVPVAIVNAILVMRLMVHNTSVPLLMKGRSYAVTTKSSFRRTRAKILNPSTSFFLRQIQ